MNSRILLTAPERPAELFLNNKLIGFDPQTEFVPDTLNTAVLERIAGGEFDGVVCQADGPEALDLVSRIRSRHLQLPVLLVSSKADTDFERQARAAGATSVVAGDLHAAVVAENVVQMLKLRVALWRLQENGVKNEQLRKELGNAILERRATAQIGRSQNRHWQRRGLLPLLIENSPQEAFQMVRAFEKAEVFAPLPLMKSAEEATEYLQGIAPFDNRNLYPLPNCILLDLNPIGLGVNLALWVRQQPDLFGIPIIVLTDAQICNEAREAFGSLANSFLIKPASFEELVAMVKSVDHYWTRINTGRLF